MKYIITATIELERDLFDEQAAHDYLQATLQPLYVGGLSVQETRIIPKFVHECQTCHNQEEVLEGLGCTTCLQAYHAEELQEAFRGIEARKKNEEFYCGCCRRLSPGGGRIVMGIRKFLVYCPTCYQEREEGNE